MTQQRSGKILTQMAVIIGLGIVIGVVDAFVTRPVDLSKRAAPKDISEVIGQAGKPTTPVGETPASSAQPAGGGEGETAPAGGGDAPAVPPPPPDRPVAAQPAAAEPVAAAGSAFVPTPKSALPPGQVTLEEAKAAFDAGAMFVDSRKLEDYKAGHIEMAIRIESSMFKAGDPPELGLIPRSAIVIVYCNGGQCDESENVAKFLTNSGYQTVYVLHDGFPGWKALGYPIATGE